MSCSYRNSTLPVQMKQSDKIKINYSINHDQPLCTQFSKMKHSQIKKGKNHNLENPNKIQPDILNELKEIRSNMEKLKNLGGEVTQITESI